MSDSKCKYYKCDTFGGTHEWVRYCEIYQCECKNGFNKKCPNYEVKGGREEMKIRISWEYTDSWVRFYYKDETYYVPKHIIEHLKQVGEEEYIDKLHKLIVLKGFLL